MKVYLVHVAGCFKQVEIIKNESKVKNKGEEHVRNTGVITFFTYIFLQLEIPISAHPVSLTELSLSRAPVSSSFLMSRDSLNLSHHLLLRLPANYHRLVTAYADEAHSFPSGVAPLTS